MKAAELRSLLLSRSKPRVRLAGDVPGIGPVYVKSATLAEQKEILRQSGSKPHPTLAGEMIVEEPIRMSALCVVKLAVDADGARIFADADIEAVEQFNVGDDYWKVVVKAAIDALNPDGDAVKATKEDFVAGGGAASSSPSR